MSQIFGHKWASQEGEIENKPGEYAFNFLNWVRKTQSLTDDQWRRGMEHVEWSVREAARQGEPRPWPPSYAEFIGYCETPPGSAMYRLHEPRRLPDKSARDRSKKLGEKTLDSLYEFLNGDSV